jgi:hypothetical protein
MELYNKNRVEKSLQNRWENLRGNIVAKEIATFLSKTAKNKSTFNLRKKFSDFFDERNDDAFTLRQLANAHGKEEGLITSLEDAQKNGGLYSLIKEKIQTRDKKFKMKKITEDTEAGSEKDLYILVEKSGEKTTIKTSNNPTGV